MALTDDQKKSITGDLSIIEGLDRRFSFPRELVPDKNGVKRYRYILLPSAIIPEIHRVVTQGDASFFKPLPHVRHETIYSEEKQRHMLKDISRRTGMQFRLDDYGQFKLWELPHIVDACYKWVRRKKK